MGRRKYFTEEARKIARKETKNRWRERNVERLRVRGREYQKVWRASRPKEYAARKLRNILHYHKLTEQEWKDLLAKGRGICGRMDKLVIDHCHKTGKVRGALCTNHNTALGKFDDSPHILRAAIRWVGGEVGWEA